MKRPNAPLQSVLVQAICDILEERRQPTAPSRHSMAFFTSYGMCQAISTDMPVLTVAPPPPPLTPETLFVELTFDIADPLTVCDQLREQLNLPPIPPVHYQTIPSTMDFQDSLPPFNKYAECGLTIDSFAEKLASWLQRRHPAVVQRIAPLTFA